MPLFIQNIFDNIRKKCSLIMLAFSFILFTCQNAKSTNLDSLIQRLKYIKPSSERIITLNKIAALSYKIDSKSAIQYAEEALDIGLKTKNQLGVLESYYQLARAFQFSSLSLLSIEACIKCIALCKLENNHIREADALYVLGRAYYQIGDINSAKENFELCHKASDQSKYEIGKAKAAKGFGDILDWEGKIAHALIQYRYSLQIYIDNNDFEGQVYGWNDLGRINETLGKQDEALDSYLKSLKIAESIGLWHGEGVASSNIGSFYWLRKDIEISLEYTYKALAIYQKISYMRGISSLYHDLAGVYRYQKKWKESREYYEKAIDLRKESDDKRGLSFSYIGLGHLAKAQKQYDQSRQYYELALGLRIDIGYKAGICISNLTIAKLLLETNQVLESYAYVEKALKMAIEIGDVEKIQSCYQTMSWYYELMNDYKKAFANEKLSRTYRDSLFNIDQIKQLANIQTLYETEKKEKKILKQENNILMLERKNGQIKLQRNSLLGSSIFLFILGIIGLKLFNIRKERNDKKEYAAALIDGQENERKRIARDLHDGIGQSLLLIKIQMEKNHLTIFENKNLINETLDEIRSISKDLHPFQLDKFGITATIIDTIEKISSNTTLFITKDIANIDGLLDPKSEIHVYRVVQESLSNIIKHAQASAAKVNILIQDNFALFEIMDNGIGFDYEWVVASSKNMGIRTMNERIASIKGKFRIENNKPNGTIISFSVPLKKLK